MKNTVVAKYAAKHPEGSAPDPQIAGEISQNLLSGGLSCAAACRLAAKLGVTLAEVGKTADLMEIPVLKCFYGLFGQSGPLGEKKLINPVASVPDEMKQAIFAKTTQNTLTCASGWRIADETGCPRDTISSYCEKLGIKITKCQLGAF